MRQGEGLVKLATPSMTVSSVVAREDSHEGRLRIASQHGSRACVSVLGETECNTLR